MNRLMQTVSAGSLALSLLALAACESTGGARRKNGFLPTSLTSYEGLEYEGLDGGGGDGALDDLRDPGTSRLRAGAGASTVTAQRAPSVRDPARQVPSVRGLTFRGEPLDDAFRTLATVTDAAILVTPAARQVIRDEALTIDLDLTVALPLPRVLDLMTGLSPELGHEYRSGVWQVGRQDEVLGGQRVSRMFDVRDLVAPRTVFLPPTMTGIPSGEFDEFGRGSGEAEDKVRAIEPDELLMLVQESLGRENFAPEGPVTLEFVDSGYLLMSGPERAVARLAGRL